jgi:hypothetical protein
LLQSGRALAAPITLTFDESEIGAGLSDGSINELYPGVFFWSLAWGGGSLLTESTDVGLIFLTRQGTAPFNDPNWVGARFDFIGMQLRAAPHAGTSETTGSFVARGYRDGVVVGSVTADVGTTFSWVDFNLRDIDILEFVDLQYVIDLQTKGGGAPFQSVSFVFDDFTYDSPELRPGALLLMTILAAFLYRRDRPPAAPVPARGLRALSGVALASSCPVEARSRRA